MPSWIKISAAAVLVLMLGTVIFLIINKPKTSNTEIVTSPKTPIQNDIAPGGDKAILTLADGTKIVLDSAANGALTEQGGVKVSKVGGQLAYNTDGKSTEVLYNTISTPKGGQYQLVLADGSKVWLNAASSLRFPTAFVGSERKVELTGEGYFEVAHDVQMPFHVKVNDMDVQVLGTHFNINSYSDEPYMKTTLLEGSVRISIGKMKTVLKPGQQASVNAKNEIGLIKNADTEQAVAWKNGYFQFDQADIKAVMRQLARWYNLDVEYSGNIPTQTFRGEIQRNLKLSQALKVLEKSNIHFKIDGSKITVLP